MGRFSSSTIQTINPPEDASMLRTENADHRSDRCRTPAVDARRVRAWISALALMLAPLAAVQAGNPLSEGSLLFDARLRGEFVDEPALPAEASALTLRTRLGWKSGSVGGVFVLIEAEDVRALDESYNSTANGRRRYPVVVDPEGSEWNQALIGWASEDGLKLQLGRQRLAYDNQRFIGNVGWRQNEQTFDAASLQYALSPQLSLNYAWLDKAHRIFGNAHPNPLLAEHDLDAHLLNGTWKGAPGSFTGYAYLIENQDLPASSTRSLGLRHQRGFGAGSAREFWYAAEYAQQQGWRAAPDSGSVDYGNAEFGLRQQGHGLRLGIEHLGSNGRRAFQTPLATGHAFNGWADRFLTTPVNGLQDLHLKLDGPLGKLRYLLALHYFEAARGDADYGREWNAQLVWPFATGWTALAKYADYHSEGFGGDVRKLWLSIEYRR
jgi:hypothetical protein